MNPLLPISTGITFLVPLETVLDIVRSYIHSENDAVVIDTIRLGTIIEIVRISFSNPMTHNYLSLLKTGGDDIRSWQHLTSSFIVLCIRAANFSGCRDILSVLLKIYQNDANLMQLLQIEKSSNYYRNIIVGTFRIALPYLTSSLRIRFLECSKSSLNESHTFNEDPFHLLASNAIIIALRNDELNNLSDSNNHLTDQSLLGHSLALYEVR